MFPKPTKKDKSVAKYIKPGRKTKEWTKARVQLKKEFLARNITECELGYPGCTRREMLSWAHTKKRRYVTDIKAVVLSCQNCHNIVEYRPDMTTILEAIILHRYESIPVKTTR